MKCMCVYIDVLTKNSGNLFVRSWALGMICSRLLFLLKGASSQVQAAIRGSGGNEVSLSEGVKASVIYVRFKAAASELKPVLEEIESRASRKEYVHILAEWHKFYCEQRLFLASGNVLHPHTKDPLFQYSNQFLMYLLIYTFLDKRHSASANI